jgi:anti-anti-sigma factor
MLQVDIESEGEAILTRLSGELDRSAREPLLKAVRTEAENTGGKVVLDCSNLSALDSEGVRALLALQTWLRIKDSEMAIAALPSKLEETIKSDAGVDKFLMRHTTVNDAMESLGLKASMSSVQTSPEEDPPPLVSTAPPVMEAPPVQTPSPPMQAPPPPEADTSGGWGAPAMPDSLPTTDTESAANSDPWKSPIQTPEPASAPAVKVVPAEPEPAAPAGAWGTPDPEPIQVAGASASPPAQSMASWQSTGPPPRLERKATKKSKLGIILGGIAVLTIIGVLAWLVIPDGSSGSPSKIVPFSPPEIIPEGYVISGRAGDLPNPSEAIFTLKNVKEDSIKVEELPDWATMRLGGTADEKTVTFTFNRLPNERPTMDRFYLEALGVNGSHKSSDVILEFEEPDAVLAIVAMELPAAQEGAHYNDSLRLEGGGTAKFLLIEGSLPEGIKLETDGRLVGIPPNGATGDYELKVRATRGEQSAEQSFVIAVKGADSQKDSAELLEQIMERNKNFDLEKMDFKTREEYDKFKSHLGRIVQDPKRYVKRAVQVSFPIGRSSVETSTVMELLGSDGLEEWVSNSRIRYLVAGFADASTGHNDLNRSIIRKRAQSLATAVREWLQETHGMSREDAYERVVVIPNLPSDDFAKPRAAECWLLVPPIVN